MDFTQINYAIGNLFGVTLFDPQQFISLIIRFVINLVVVLVIARRYYYPRSLRRDYMFIFILMAMSIFLLVSLMDGGGMQLGAAMGLFAIFGIMRFRTEAVPIREMTYLFILIAVSVVNAVAKGDYHPKADYWDGVGIVTILFVNIVFIVMAWLFESSKMMSDECSKIILYDNVMANVSGLNSPQSFNDIDDVIKQKVDYVVKYRQDDTQAHKASNIILLRSDSTIKIIR